MSVTLADYTGSGWLNCCTDQNKDRTIQHTYNMHTTTKMYIMDNKNNAAIIKISQHFGVPILLPKL